MAAASEHNRQMRLPEVGEQGQRRIEAGVLRIRAGVSGLVELAYLERAGVGSVHVAASRAAPAFPHGAEFRHSVPRELAAGAWRALGGIVALLEGAP